MNLLLYQIELMCTVLATLQEMKYLEGPASFNTRYRCLVPVSLSYDLFVQKCEQQLKTRTMILVNGNASTGTDSLR